MAGTAYHLEALRKQRVVDKQIESKKLLHQSIGQQRIVEPGTDGQMPDALAFSEIGHYQQTRCRQMHMAPTKEDVVFEEVVHDPNFKYRMLKESGSDPMHVDPIYKIMYPGH